MPVTAIVVTMCVLDATGRPAKRSPCRAVGGRIGARTIDALWRAIGGICALYAEEECWS
jgi:hypothetical protein